MAVLPGLFLALLIAFAGQYLSHLIGVDLMGLPKSPISAIMMAILLGILIRNTITLPAAVQPGIRFGLVRVLRLGIVLQRFEHLDESLRVLETALPRAVALEGSGSSIPVLLYHHLG